MPIYVCTPLARLVGVPGLPRYTFCNLKRELPVNGQTHGSIVGPTMPGRAAARLDSGQRQAAGTTKGEIAFPFFDGSPSTRLTNIGLGVFSRNSGVSSIPHALPLCPQGARTTQATRNGPGWGLRTNLAG